MLILYLKPLTSYSLNEMVEYPGAPPSHALFSGYATDFCAFMSIDCAVQQMMSWRETYNYHSEKKVCKNTVGHASCFGKRNV